MSGLVLKLAPGERLLVNGAVIENGDRRSRFSIITPGAHILRLRDALHPREATTPVSRACYMAQLVLSGDATEQATCTELLAAIDQLDNVMADAASRLLLSQARQSVASHQYYAALKTLRGLLPGEARLLAEP
ncbi:flagellar biosynthesis repressor FlbT [Haematobacter missouriensis]|uniref:Flagellar biosynthesis repressor FlbT n=1 Tax=Haematobacter missouriensis TaxID=366616 RepID=A0A212AUE2_9RHOB|nr:flagellar biosynthesis repressor FlbT [Haematobacter missouriensis]KFI33423.1 flagellar biosynthesis repressor FlbT [Haematobacter missouriensis]OWJ75151.1 flagellar biosynthesis repressor FlbT [Haematobacter missouriensis]OWJ85103.1 flagellar biosynthesis repressor FlbT [Haematobacter missouriensis]